MICTACAELRDDAPTCTACGADPLLRGRWRLDERLGQGASGVVYGATDLRTGARVAVKEVALGRHLLGEAAAACDREARVLRELDHPAIPALVDAFVAGRALWVVRAFVEGESLDREAAHHRYSEDEVLALLDELLGVLAYLHARSPPVIHRDIKPGNVIRRPDGHVALVDFGSVRDRAGDASTRTAAGTFGYMAPEQLRGDAAPGTDIYGLGALAVALLTRVDPASLLDWSHRLVWRRHVSIRPATADLLDRMVEPDPRKRMSDATAVRAAVRRLREGGARTWTGERGAVRMVAIAIALVAGSVAAVSVGSLLWMTPPRMEPPAPPPVPRVEPEPPTSEASVEPPPPPVEPAPSPPTSEPVEPDDSTPIAEPAGPIGSLIRDPKTGTLYEKLGESAVVECALGELGGLLTAQQAYDAAFDQWQPDFAEAGWAPGAKCKWYLAFAVEVKTPSDLALHGIVTRGSGRGRHFVMDLGGDMREVARLGTSALRQKLRGPLTWTGNVDP